MNYVLQIVRGRSEASTLKLMDGVNSIGRHNDCLIRIRSSQVSRRHCELFENSGRLMVRDLGSANGTFVNGKRVLGQQALNAGDVLTIGGVTLKVGLAGQAASTGPKVPPGSPKPGDTAEVDAIVLEDDDLELEEEFEVEIDAEPVPGPEAMGIIPLNDEPPPPKTTKGAKPAAQTTSGTSPKKDSTKSDEAITELTDPKGQGQTSAEEEEAVAQFLMDLKLDDED